MTVSELIAHLHGFPQDLQVGYRIYSEYALVEANDVSLMECQPVRPDGWIHSARPDAERQKYVMFPGN